MEGFGVVGSYLPVVGGVPGSGLDFASFRYDGVLRLSVTGTDQQP